MISDLKNIGQQCWVVEETGCSLLGRRMTVINCNQNLFLHSCIALDESGLTALNKLGTVKWILVPNMYHTKDIVWYSKQFPSAEILCASPLEKKLHKLGLTNLKFIPDYCPELLLDHVTFKVMESIKDTEIECYHHNSKSLILTDLLFNLNPTKLGLFGKCFHGWNQSDRLNITRIFKLVFMLNKDILSEEIHELMGLNFDKIILSHGDIVTKNAKEKLANVLKSL